MSGSLSYPYRILEISFDCEGEALLGIEITGTGQMVYRSAYHLFFNEEWFTKFSPDDIRAIAGFALEDRWKRDQRAIMQIEQESS